MPPTTGIQSAIMWIWPKTMGNQYESMGIRYYNTADFPLPAWIAEGYAPPRSGCDQQLLLQLWDIPQKRGCKQQYCVNERVETVTTPLRIPHVFCTFLLDFTRFFHRLPGFSRPLRRTILHQFALHIPTIPYINYSNYMISISPCYRAWRCPRGSGKVPSSVLLQRFPFM